MTALVSIIIPTKNRVLTLKDTILSVQQQVYKTWEVLVIDDGSTDNTEEFIEAIIKQDNRFFYYKRLGNIEGGNRCRNIGLQKAIGEYVIFLDSDDLLEPHCLSRRMEITKTEKNIDFYVFPGAVFNSNDKNKPLYYWNIASERLDIERFLMFDSPWQTTGPIWNRKALIKKEHHWDETLFIWQDVDFHILAIIKDMSYKVFWQEKVDYWVREDSKDSVSRMDYYNPIKIHSRLLFWNKYLYWFKYCNLITAKLLRPVFLNLIHTFIVIRDGKIVHKILNAAFEKKIISNQEFRIFRVAVFLSKLSMNKVPYRMIVGQKIIASLNPVDIYLNKIPIKNQ